MGAKITVSPMMLPEYVAIGVLILSVPLFLRRTFGGRKSGAEQDKENPVRAARPKKPPSPSWSRINKARVQFSTNQGEAEGFHVTGEGGPLSSNVSTSRASCSSCSAKAV
jgi:hypothetical protein